MRAGWWILILMATVGGGPATAQSVAAGRTGPRPLLPREREIALARTAAPLEVSRDASVMVFTERGFEVAAPLLRCRGVGHGAADGAAPNRAAAGGQIHRGDRP